MRTPCRDEHLTNLYFDEAISDAELAELQQLLVTDRDAADRFANRSRLEAALSSSFNVATQREKAERLGLNVVRLRRGNRREWLMAGAAALLGLSICAYWMVHNRREDGSSAEVVRGHLNAGKVSTRRVALDTPVRATERSEITLRDSSRVTLEKDAVLALRPALTGERQVVELIEGKSTFKIAKAPGVFRVSTKAGSVKVLGTEFSVELQPASNEAAIKGGDTMKLSTVMLVAVISGMVEVNVGNVSYNLAGGQSRAFAEEGRGGREAIREGRNKNNFIGEIVGASNDRITVSTGGEGGSRSAKITAETHISIQSMEDEVRVGEGGQEFHIPKMSDAVAGDLKVGERAKIFTNEDGAASKIIQLRHQAAGGREGLAKRDGERNAEGGERKRDGDVAKREGERKEGDEARRDVDRKRDAEGVKKDGDRKRDGDAAVRGEGERKRDGDAAPRAEGERKRDGDAVKREGDGVRRDGERKVEGDGVKRDGERKREGDAAVRGEGERKREGDGVKREGGNREGDGARREGDRKVDGGERREGGDRNRDGAGEKKETNDAVFPATRVKPNNDQ